MKYVITLLAVVGLFSAGAQAETLVCQQWGYANNPDGFHDIKLEKYESTFLITDQNVLKRPVGQRYDQIDPELVGLDGIEAKTYRLGSELLYIYSDKGKVNVGISHLVEDSDVFFGDKELFSDCSYKKPEGESPYVATSEPMYAAETRGIKGTVSTYRF